MVLLAGLVILSGCLMTTEASPGNVTLKMRKKDFKLKMRCRTDDNQFIPKTRAHDTDRVFDWPQGKVPYRFEGRVTFNDRKLIRSAMKQIEAQTCIRFNEDQKPPRHYLRILVESPSCDPCGNGGCISFSAEVKTQGGSPVVTLISYLQLADQPHCRENILTKGGIVHELMHALGIQHTQKRSDRDAYIRVNTQNIQRDSLSQYSPPCHSCDNHGIPYDCSSIMHYGTETFSNGNGPTMTPKVAGCSISGQGRSVATKNDWDMLRAATEDQCSGGGGSGCPYTDKNKSCPNWKDQGYCTSGSYVEWMATNCAKSCKCNAASCPYKDEWSNCQRYKKYCTSGSFVAFMAKVCAKTCKC